MQNYRLRAFLVPITVAVAASLGAAAPAAATPSALAGTSATAGHAKLSLSAPSGPPTLVITVRGTGFGPGERVAIRFDAALKAQTKARASGQFGPVKIAIPRAAAPGGHVITAKGKKTKRKANVNFTVSTVWTQFRFSGDHSGQNPTENVLKPGNVHKLVKKWSFPTGDSIGSSPAVAGGAVYVGDSNDNLYAVSIATGKKLWSFTTGGGVFSSPAVSDGVVYVGSFDDNLYAFALP